REERVVHRPDPTLDGGKPLRERRRRGGRASGVDPLDRLCQGSPQPFKRIPLRCTWLEQSFDPLDRRIGVGGCRRAAAAGGGRERRRRRGRRVAALVAGRPAALSPPIVGIGRRKGGCHDGVIAVRPKAVVAFREKHISNEIIGGIGPKY